MEPFNGLGTPVAYLLDERGRVATPIAVGADNVPVLARYAVGEATVSELSVQPAQGGKPSPTCGQIAVKPEEIVGVGPGTELKRLLAVFRIPVTPDCPCNERAALMNAKGWAWCEENLETIVQWMREEAARRQIRFIGVGARILVKRAIVKARRREQKSERTVGTSMASAQERCRAQTIHL